MVKDVLKYYTKVALKHKRYTLPPLILAPLARILSDMAAPYVLSLIINRISAPSRPSLHSMVWYGVAFFGLPIFGEVLWRVTIFCLNRAEAYGMKQIAEETFADLMSRSHDFHANNFAGALVAKANRFTNSFEPLFDTLVFNILGTLSSVGFGLIVLLRSSITVGGIFVVAMTIYILVISRLTKTRFRLGKLRAETESTLTGQLADSLTNAVTTKTFAKESHELKLFTKINERATTAKLNAWDYQNLPMDAVTTSMVNGLNVIALIGTLAAVYSAGAKIGSVFLIMAYVQQLTGKFWDFSRIMRAIEGNISNAVEMMSVLKQENTVVNTSGAETLSKGSGKIELRDVAFSYYKTKKSSLFEGLNLQIEPGQTIGLVGPSGGGKTTITKLLLRFMDIRSGSIQIDGQDIALVTQESLRDAITYVPQEPLLFHRTLAENIRYGRPGASMKSVIEAAKKANAHEFIVKLPDGYETMVGERGIKLSGGQRQRVAIARAILKNAPIVVLDEATSALDSESEKLIQQALFTLMQGRTSIVIAHRLSTIKHLDRILVLEDGKITEDGTHDELTRKKSGTYAKLWAHQSGGFIE
jgi:ATP-binding cassette, subfamily B, bacterial